MPGEKPPRRPETENSCILEKPAEPESCVRQNACGQLSQSLSIQDRNICCQTVSQQSHVSLLPNILHPAKDTSLVLLHHTHTRFSGCDITTSRPTDDSVCHHLRASDSEPAVGCSQRPVHCKTSKQTIKTS